MFSKQVPHLFNILNDVESVNYFSPILCRAFSTSQLFFSVPDPCVSLPFLAMLVLLLR